MQPADSPAHQGASAGLPAASGHRHVQPAFRNPFRFHAFRFIRIKELQPFNKACYFRIQELILSIKEFILRHKEQQHHITQQFVFRQKRKFNFTQQQLRFQEQFSYL